MIRFLLAAASAALVLIAPPLSGVGFEGEAQAQNRQPAAAGRRPDPFAGFGGNSKDPIRIDADKLEVFDKDQKAVYTGDVVAVRGTTTIRASTMTIYYDNAKQGQGGQAANAGAPPTQDGALKRIEFKGPVNVVNCSQTASSNELIYDAQAKTVTLKGNAVVADGPNVQRGEVMVYNTDESVARITNPGGRVQAVVTPGGQDDAQRPKC
jgi:lipopolysaccharide export system protein LptA